MKIIISPAKKMNVDTDTFTPQGMPVFLEETEILMRWMQSLSFENAKKLWGCNDKLAELNFQRFRQMNLRKMLTPALISYEGIQYQYMAPQVFTGDEWDYVQKHLRILSGFYGVLKPLDGVTPYRLEMQAKAKVCGARNLYEFWGRRLYQEIVEEDVCAAVSDYDRMVLNLASKEYSKCIEKYVQPQDTFLTCIFGELKDGKVVQKGTQAKMARGEMVRFAAENKVEDFEQLKKFDRLGYCFRPELSSKTEYIFIMNS